MIIIVLGLDKKKNMVMVESWPHSCLMAPSSLPETTEVG